MRTIGIAGAIVALVAADGAGAQRMIAHGPGVGYPAPGAGGYANHYTAGAPMRPIGVPQGGHRWGSKVGGHWWGGVNAPGGWNGYRRPYRGYALPGYWVSPRFGIDDWSTYGLSQPAYGYRWMRYYDDAVLVDSNGSVYDTVGGLDWDRYDGGYDTDETVYAGPGDRGYPQPAYAQPAYAQPAYAQPAYAPAPPPAAYAPAPGYGAGYAQPGYAQPGYAQPYAHRSSGVGGAIAGAAVGGIAGNLIAGRGNRLAGTLIGAGVGGAAGYAIDRSSNPRQPGYGAGYGEPPVAPRHPPRPPRGGYDQPVPPEYGYAPPPPPPPPRGGSGGWTSADGRTVVTTTSAGYYGGSTTTVVVQTAPVVTTTTTELIEDDVTYTRPHRKWHRAPSKVHVRCGCSR